MLTSLLFERPWTLLLTLVAVQFILIGYWSWRRSVTAARVVWVGFGLIPLLLIVSRLVVTPVERMIFACRDLAQAVDEGDVNAIQAALSPDFEVEGLPGEEFLAHVERALTQYRVDDERLWGFDCEVEGPDRGMAEFTAYARIRSADVDLGWVPTRWRIRFRGANDLWLVTTLEPLPIPPLQLRSIRSLFR